MICPDCGTSNPAQARFCMGCGRLLLEGILCQSCNTILPHQARFCYNCGAVALRPAGKDAQPQRPQPAQAATSLTVPIATRVTPQPAPAPPEEEEKEAEPVHITEPDQAPRVETGKLPPARPARQMKLSLRRYLPDTLYQPLEDERDYTPAQLEQVRDHLTHLLRTTKTYLPRPVIEAPQPAGTPAGGMYRGVFLFGDVSGFTPLSEKLKQQGQEGAERITRIINDLFTALVKVLFAHGGALLKFGGDALLGLFPAQTDEQMQTGALHAAQAAMTMQEVMKAFEAIPISAEETHALKIKCGISSGPYFAAHIGTKPRVIDSEGRTIDLGALTTRPDGRTIDGEGRVVDPDTFTAEHAGTMAYVTTGHTVNRTEQAEGHANPGDVVITRNTYALIQDQIDVGPAEKEPNDDHFKILHAPPNADILARTGAPPPEDEAEQLAYLTEQIVAAPGDSALLARATLEEPPPGDTDAQVTYLVERLDLLAPYLSNELVGRIVNNPGNPRIEPEHRPVTVMFANYKGISDLIEDLGEEDPDIITQQLNDYFVHMAGVVEKYEGTLARMDQYAVGDRLVIFFGAPRAHEDDPVRAVYTALDMQAAAREHFAAFQTAGDVYRFEQRVGINTGHLFAGNAGATGLRQEYTLMGDDINMAARLMSSAKFEDPNHQIYISSKTRERIGDFFQLSDRFTLQVKGKKIRIETYAVQGYKHMGSQVRGLDEEAALTGRTRELETVQRCGTGLLNRRGQILALTGEGGMGKTRLMREFETWLREEDESILWLRGQALSFSEQMSYWVAAQMFRGALDLPRDASEDDIIYRLSEKTKTLLGRDAARDAFPLLGLMIGLELTGKRAEEVKALDPKVRQKRTFWAAREFITALARQQPTVVVLDDLHWADEASLALVENLLEVTVQAPLMFCLLMRPVRDKGCWRLRNRAMTEFHHRYTEVALQPLDESQRLAMLERLLPGAVFPDRALSDILKKSGGNPFYLEEVVRSLIESSAVIKDEEDGAAGLAAFALALKGDTPQETRWKVTDQIEKITVPDTLQGAIVARIDRLTEDARQALQKAAVIGSQFRVQLLGALERADTKIDAVRDEITLWVDQLESSDLIRPAEQTTGSTYTFSDALVREVAYENLLMQRRKAFHQQVGEALEAEARQRDEEAAEGRTDWLKQEAGRLADHFYQSGDTERAAKYLEMAVESAQENFAPLTALQHYEKLLTLQERQNDRSAQANTLYLMGKLAYEIGSYPQARSRLERSAALLEENPFGKSWSVMYLGMIDLKQGSYLSATRYHEEARQLAQQQEQTEKFAGIHLTNLARVLLRMGAYDDALAKFQESLVYKTQNNDYLGLGFSHFYMGLAHLYQGHLDEAKADIDAAMAAWEQVGSKSARERGIAYARHGQGLLALAQEAFGEAEKHFYAAYEICDAMALNAEVIENLSYLGQARLGLGKREDAAKVSQRAIDLLKDQKDVEAVQQIYLNHYRVLAAQQNPEANSSLQQAREAMHAQADQLDESARQRFLENVPANREIAHSGTYV